MNRETEKSVAPEVFYPDSDGQPMADNEANQDRMIATRSALREAFSRRGEPACVSMDIFVYPVEGDPGTKCAPDLLVAPGCPPGPRPSFKCWEEPGPIVLAGEFLSPVTRERFKDDEIQERIAFYRDRLATPEVFVYEPKGLDIEDGFRFYFLRLGKDGTYHQVRPGKGGWYASQTLPFELRPANERIEVRDARTGEEYLPPEMRAKAEAERARQEAARADLAERRARDLEEELARLKQRLQGS